MKKTGAQAGIIGAMCIYGTIGLFVRYIPLPSSVTAMVRGIVGGLLLLAFIYMKGARPDGAAIRKNFWRLVVSGGVMGFNWILLFEAYRFTSVATATLCYYLAPVFLTLASPLVLREKITAKKLICVLVALLGMIPVSGVLGAGFRLSELGGVALGVGAAALYATVILLNKKLTDISAIDRTMVQLLSAGVVLVPYVLATENVAALRLDTVGIVLLAVVAVVHTGLAYVLYFGALPHLSVQSAAILSYVDPVVAVLLSVLVLKDTPFTPSIAVGALLILGAAFLGEVEVKKCTGEPGSPLRKI